MQRPGSYGRPFLLYLFGQGALDLGDSFRFIAVTVLIYKLTGSGVSTALGLVFSAVPGVLLSSFAGAAGDLLNEKYLLAGIDIAKAAAMLPFLFHIDLNGVYVMLVLLSALDTFYNPSRRKFILRLAGKKGVVGANSLLTGVSGAAYLTGPLAAGVLTDAYGPSPAFLLCIAACIISSGATLLVRADMRIPGRVLPEGPVRGPKEGPVKGPGKSLGEGAGKVPGKGLIEDPVKGPRKSLVKGPREGAGKVPVKGLIEDPVKGPRKSLIKGPRQGPGRSLREETAAGFVYCKRTPPVREVIYASVMTGFCAIAINMAFYPYAFDSLQVTAKGWSLMITIYYGTNLMALPAMDMIGKGGKMPDFRIFYGGLFLTGTIWLFYPFTSSYPAVLLLQFLEGTILAVCGILLSSRMQLVSAPAFLARVAGVCDILSGGAKLFALGFALLIMNLASFRLVFLTNSAVFLVFSLYSLAVRPGGVRRSY